jgi:hypothetical protein
MKALRLLACFLLLTVPHFGHGQAKGSDSPSESARKFVQEFYDWYTPGVVKASERGRQFDWRSRASDFDPALFRALKEDDDAQAKTKGEIVGLDFDPFLNSQDPCAPYKARKVIQKRDHYWVEVDLECEHIKAERPIVTVEVMSKDGHWVFVNFHYSDPKPSGADLLSTLQALKKDREGQSK